MYMSQYEWKLLAVKSEDFQKFIQFALKEGISVNTVEGSESADAFANLASENQEQFYNSSEEWQDSGC